MSEAAFLIRGHYIRLARGGLQGEERGSELRLDPADPSPSPGTTAVKSEPAAKAFAHPSFQIRKTKSLICRKTLQVLRLVPLVFASFVRLSVGFMFVHQVCARGEGMWPWGQGREG